VRLLDFGIATQLERAEISSDRRTTTVRLLTPAYAAPEQVRGERTDACTDVFSLGVILYELLAGRLPTQTESGTGARLVSAAGPVRPTAAAKAGAGAVDVDAGSWTELDVICLTAMHDDPARRYQSVAALIKDIDHFLNDEPLDARSDGVFYRMGKLVRRNGRVLAASLAVLVVVSGLALTAGLLVSPSLSRTPSSSVASGRTVAVLPFLNVSGDGGLDYLRLAVAEEVETALGYARSLSVRPVLSTSQHVDVNRDAATIGRDLGVTWLVTGTFELEDGDLRVWLEALDVQKGDVLWRDGFRVRPGNMIALQQNIAMKAQGGLSDALGASETTSITATRPRNEEAYSLYLRSAGGRYDPGSRNTDAIAMLTRAVALDPSYAPAWLALSRRYYIEARYATGNEAFLQDAIVANERALELDPNFITARARMTAIRVELGDLVEAYREAVDLVRRRPDSPDVHYTLSYVLRFAGLLQEAARECETALSLDPHNWGWRSCAVVPLARGDYNGAIGYIQLDPGSEWAKALTIHALVGAGREAEALEIGRPDMPRWTSYDVLLACAAGRPETEVAALASSVSPDTDPEANYYAAAHLAYCGQSQGAVGMLRRAIDGGYCSYPAVDSDPYFARLRGTPEFADVRAAAMACQEAFLSQRAAGSSLNRAVETSGVDHARSR
jgi:serine/threonine-protein kinase